MRKASIGAASASPSRLATPTRILKGQTPISSANAIALQPAQNLLPTPDWLLSLDESDNLLDEDVPAFMAGEFPLDDRSIVMDPPSFPSQYFHQHSELALTTQPDHFEASHHILPSSIVSNEDIAEDNTASPVAFSVKPDVVWGGNVGDFNSNRQDLFHDLSMANPIDEMSIYNSDGVGILGNLELLQPNMTEAENNYDSCDGRHNIIENKQIFKFARDEEDPANQNIDDCGEDDDISIMCEQPPISVSNSDGEEHGFEVEVALEDEGLFNSGVIDKDMEYQDGADMKTPTAPGHLGLSRRCDTSSYYEPIEALVVESNNIEAVHSFSILQELPSLESLEAQEDDEKRSAALNHTFTSIEPFDNSREGSHDFEQSQVTDDSRITEMVLASAVELGGFPSVLRELDQVGDSAKCEVVQIQSAKETEVDLSTSVVEDIALSSIRLSKSNSLEASQEDEEEAVNDATNGSFSSVQFSKLSIPCDEDDVALEEAAVSNIQISSKAEKSDDGEETTPFKTRRLLSDSFVGWNVDVDLQVLDEMSESPSHQDLVTPKQVSNNILPAEQSSLYFPAVEHKSPLYTATNDSMISLQTFDASRLPVKESETSARNELNLLDQVDVSMMGSDEEVLGFQSCLEASPTRISASKATFHPSNFQSIFENAVSDNPHSEETSSFERYVRSERPQHRSMSTLRIDSGVVDGPEDLSEVPPGHPEPSHVVLVASNNSNALSLSMLKDDDLISAKENGLFMVTGSLSLPVAETCNHSFSPIGMSGELKLDDIADEGDSQVLRPLMEAAEASNQHGDGFHEDGQDIVCGSGSGAVLLGGFLKWNQDQEDKSIACPNAGGDGDDVSGFRLDEQSLDWLGDRDCVDSFLRPTEELVESGREMSRNQCEAVERKPKVAENEIIDEEEEEEEEEEDDEEEEEHDL
ncbi:hypothetical protein BDR26DRAFT_38173 [Obelidium mucronatum]|nr:hypothetical protein BDR26DRAFT_38173 [Obelidium mucronatum]